MYIRTQRALAVGVSGLMRIIMRRFSFSSPCFSFFIFVFSKIKEESYPAHEQSPPLCKFSSSAVLAVFALFLSFLCSFLSLPHLLSYFSPAPLTEFSEESPKRKPGRAWAKKEKPGDEVAWHPHPGV